MMTFPTTARDPSGKMVSILVTPDGKLVTDLSALPATVVPIQQVSLRVDATGTVLVA